MPSTPASLKVKKIAEIAGFSEVLTDSDGDHYSTNLGKVLTKKSDRLKLKYQRRNKLKALAAKNQHIIKNNLGSKKLNT